MYLYVCMRVFGAYVYLFSAHHRVALDLSLKMISNVFLRFLSESSITLEWLTRTKEASVFRVANAVSIEINSIRFEKRRLFDHYSVNLETRSFEPNLVVSSKTKFLIIELVILDKMPRNFKDLFFRNKNSIIILDNSTIFNIIFL